MTQFEVVITACAGDDLQEGHVYPLVTGEQQLQNRSAHLHLRHSKIERECEKRQQSLE